MLTAEQNEVLSRVGPGTPGGDLLRRYWQPVAMAPAVDKEHPTRALRILGEDLVLFRDTSGRVGLLADHCAHRGASLLYGRVEERGIACAYHGWLYDTAGNCLECPAEPAGSGFHRTVRQRAYPVERFFGLYWAYLGPPPAPPLPRYDFTERAVMRYVGEVPHIDCNWVQVMENNLDPAHIPILHQDARGRDRESANTTRGFVDDLGSFDFREVDFGILRARVDPAGVVERDYVIFPNAMRDLHEFSIKVPIDDAHTKSFRVFVDLDDPTTLHAEANPDARPGSPEPEYYVVPVGDAKSPPDAIYPTARYRMDELRFQDFMAMETQGPIAGRDQEHLAASDWGIVMYREMLFRELERVQRGLDPLGIVRDPERVIETEIASTPRPESWRGPTGLRVDSLPTPTTVS